MKSRKILAALCAAAMLVSMTTVTAFATVETESGITDEDPYTVPDEDAPPTITNEGFDENEDPYVVSDEDAPPTIIENSAADNYATGADITGDQVKVASETSDFTLYIKLNEAAPFSVTACVHLKVGNDKHFEIQGSGKNAESWFPMQDMLTALNITADEIDYIHFENADAMKSASFINTWGKDDGKDTNPATGAGLAVLPMIVAGVGMIATKKRK